MKSKLYILLTMLLACTMQVKGVTSTVEVGTKSNSARFVGFADDYTNFASQTLYRPSDMKQSGFITGFAYQVVSPSEKTVSGSLKIYMALTDQNTMLPSNKLSIKDFTLVYSNTSASLGKTTAGWKEFSLQTPFYYDINKKLVVAISVEKIETVYSTYAYYDASDQYIRIANSSNIEAETLHENPFVPVTRFTFSEQSTPVEVGTSSGTSNMTGFGDGYNYYGTQILYTIDEIGQTGAISEIAFATTESDRNTSKGTYTVYMAEVDQNTLTVDNRIKTPSQMKQVYYGTATLKVANGYESLQLKTPFYYSGTKNLVVAISSINTSTYNLYYKRYKKSDRVVRYDNSSSSNYAPAFHATGLKNFDYVPVTKFTFSVASSCGNKTRIVGEATNYSVLTGMGLRYKYYATQILYTPQEFGSVSREITYLGFQVYQGITGGAQSNVKIYLAETDLESITPSSQLSESQMTLVYEGNPTLGSKTGFETLTFSKPFVYTGRKNLVVAVSSSNPDSTPLVYYQASNGNQNRAILWRSNDNASYANPFTSIAAEAIGYLPNIRFGVKGHAFTTSKYTPEGLAICDNCGHVVPCQYEPPTRLESYTYGVSKVNHLNYIAQRVAWGSFNSSYHFYIQNDLDLNGKDWSAIGNNGSPFVSYLHGCDYSNKVGHTISGVGSSQYLIGTLGTNGQVQSVRLASGRLVKTGTSGKVSSCLTLGSALFGSRTSTVIDSSFYVSNTANTIGGRTSAQMKSGMVTYGLNHAATTGGAKWYQTIGSDNYPVFDSSKGTVYRCTKCEKVIYTNTSSDEGKVYPHTWVNTICKVCNSQPTTFAEDQSLSFNSPYSRAVEARMTNGAKLTYQRDYGLLTLNKWQPLFVPFSFEYQSGWTEYFDIAEIQSYGVIEDTNEDGIVNSQDEKKLIVSYLKPGDKTTANAPYLIMPKSGKVSKITFESCDGIVYPNTVSSLDLSTMKENVAIVGNYTSGSSCTTFQMEDGVLKQRTASIPYFTWIANPTYKNGKAWDQNEINIFAHHLGSLDLIDGSSTYTIAQKLVYDNVSYARSFDEEMAHNWQAVYLPFDVVVEKKQDSEYPKYATFRGVRTEKGVEVFYLDMHKDGDVIPACTPFLVCFDEPTNLNLKYSMATVYPCNGGEDLCLSSDQANYTIAGVFAPTKPSASTWYAIARFDGKFHPASSTATLPAFRFYMTIEGANASELRFAFRDAQEIETGIATVAPDVDNQDIYSLDGRKVQSESILSGIYIKNGKKFSVRK